MTEPDGLLTIDLAAIAANWRRIKQLAPGAEVAAVVKADAYGLGMAPVARALAAAGARVFCVATFAEGAELRALLPGARIGLLNGLPADDLKPLIELKLWPALNSLPDLRRWQAEAKLRERPLPAILHVDTGLNRLGLEAADLDALANRRDALAGLELKLVMSHLACADEPDHPLNRMQLEAFRRVLDRFPQAPASLANSAGVLLGRDYQFDLVRPGCALYGIRPAPGAAGFSPVVRLSTRVLQIRRIKPGETVGYGASFRAETAGRIAILAAGYADGWPRALSGAGHVAYAGRRLPILGRVSMDLCAIDVSSLPEGQIMPGDRVDLIGPGNSADQVAAESGTIGYEILTRLGKRHQRRYTGGHVD